MNYTATRKDIVCELFIHLSDEEMNKLFAEAQKATDAAPADVRTLAQERFVPNILEKEGLTPISPLIPSENLPEPGKDYDFTVKFERIPDIALPGDLKSISIEVPAPSMDGSRARKMADALRHSFAKRSEVRERRNPAYGEVVIISMQGRCGDCPAPGFQAENRAFLLHKNGSLLPEIQTEIMAMLPGENRTMTLVCPDDYPYAGMRGKPLELDIHLKSVWQETLPDINDALAGEVGFDSVKALETSIMAKSLSNELAEIQKEGEQRLLQKLLAEIDVPTPSYPAQRFHDEFMQNARQALRRAGCSDTQIEEQLSSMKDEARQAAESQARSHVFLLALAERECIRVSEEDMNSEIERMAGAMKDSPASVRERLKNSGLEDDVRERILAAKTLTFLYHKAHKVVVDAQGNPVPPPAVQPA